MLFSVVAVNHAPVKSQLELKESKLESKRICQKLKILGLYSFFLTKMDVRQWYKMYHQGDIGAGSWLYWGIFWRYSTARQTTESPSKMEGFLSKFLLALSILVPSLDHLKYTLVDNMVTKPTIMGKLFGILSVRGDYFQYHEV